MTLIPPWCGLRLMEHDDGLGGCWSLHHGVVTKWGDCVNCEAQLPESTKMTEYVWPQAEASIRWLVETAHRTMVEKGFHDPEVTLGNQPAILAISRLGLVATEVGEAIEEVRDGRKLTELRFRADGKPEGFPAELADIVLRVCDIAGVYGVNLGEAIRLKAEFNKTRPRKHGKEC